MLLHETVPRRGEEATSSARAGVRGAVQFHLHCKVMSCCGGPGSASDNVEGLPGFAQTAGLSFSLSLGVTARNPSRSGKLGPSPGTASQRLSGLCV